MTHDNKLTDIITNNANNTTQHNTDSTFTHTTDDIIHYNTNNEHSLTNSHKLTQTLLTEHIRHHY